MSGGIRRNGVDSYLHQPRWLCGGEGTLKGACSVLPHTTIHRRDEWLKTGLCAAAYCCKFATLSQKILQS